VRLGPARVVQLLIHHIARHIKRRKRAGAG
jgi:hypothetical protein